jgi:BirA family transcriptional regulator, biotin operon repressor / biotin---[acetyl-CoA-carboxylase] ligase
VTASAQFPSRRESFGSVDSTNDIVRGWLADGADEVCLAVAGEQKAGRGRAGRTWVAPQGAALLLSLGFRPTYLEPSRYWRLSAIVALAMIDAAEEAAGLGLGTVKIKWPNDLVVERDGELRKLAGILGESDGAGTADPSVIVGIGTNTEWSPADFPPDLAGSMTSLRELAAGRPIDSAELLELFLARLELRVESLRGGHFDVAAWHERQATTGRSVTIDMPDGSSLRARAVGVDGSSGAIIVDAGDGAGERELLVGEIVRVRLDSGVTN